MARGGVKGEGGCRDIFREMSGVRGLENDIPGRVLHKSLGIPGVLCITAFPMKSRIRIHEASHTTTYRILEIIYNCSCKSDYIRIQFVQLYVLEHGTDHSK